MSSLILDDVDMACLLADSLLTFWEDLIEPGHHCSNQRCRGCRNFAEESYSGGAEIRLWEMIIIASENTSA